MNSFILLLIALITGMLVELTDLVDEHNLKLFKFSNYLFGLSYGILITITIILFPIIAPLWLGAVIANTIYGRVDSKGHYAAFLILIVALIIFWNFKINIWLLVIFIIAAIIDEIFDDFQDKKRKFRLPIRPFLNITALIVSIVLGNFIILFAILAFDIGYDITKYLGEKK